MDDKSIRLKMPDKKSFTIEGFFSCLLHSVTQVHIFHFQTKSYAAHIALGSFYEDVEDLVDTLIESYQGKYGIVKGYKNSQLKDLTNPVDYFKDLHQEVESSRKLFTDSDLLNIMDEIKTLIKTTLYKLENLN